MITSNCTNESANDMMNNGQLNVTVLHVLCVTLIWKLSDSKLVRILKECFLIARNRTKCANFVQNLHVLSWFIQLKSVPLIFCVFWIFFQNDETLFQVGYLKKKFSQYLPRCYNRRECVRKKAEEDMNKEAAQRSRLLSLDMIETL